MRATKSPSLSNSQPEENAPGQIQAALYLRASTAQRTHTLQGEEFRQRPEIQEERLRRLAEQLKEYQPACSEKP